MASPAVQQAQADRPKSRKGQRPNYNQIHQNLLPLQVYPLPPLIPHNPLSLLAIALTYLTQVLAPPRRQIYDSYFSPATSSVHVTDPTAIRALWEMGFFGRGSLSRSEPTWLETQKKKGSTAEENTGKRRDQRRQQKLERAKLEQQEITDQLMKEKEQFQTLHDLKHAENNFLKTNEMNLNGIEDIIGSGNTTPTNQQGGIQDFAEWKTTVTTNGLPTPPPTTTSSETDQPDSRPMKRLQRSKSVRFSPTIEAREFDLSSPVISPIKGPGLISSEQGTKVVDYPENKEHLNLSLEEAFFLAYGLGVLNVYCENTDTVLPATSLLPLFRRHSYFPARSLSVSAEPDDPFMLSYAVYHHYRSLGWVVRSGVKFSTDYLLYNRGPAFSHAEFAIIIVPSYGHRYWKSSSKIKKQFAEKSQKSWWWLHSVNRVQAQVHKHLVLCYIEVPPPLNKIERGESIDIGKELSRYKIRDIGIRRWTPNRSRD